MCLLAMCLFRSLLHFELFPHSVQANTPFSISFTMESSSSLLTEVSINPEMEVKIYITGTWWYSLFYFTILFIFIFLLLSLRRRLNIKIFININHIHNSKNIKYVHVNHLIQFFMHGFMHLDTVDNSSMIASLYIYFLPVSYIPSCY